jgi:uncharacterized membrane protein YdjX (TVP38/TMEM64 family)
MATQSLSHDPITCPVCGGTNPSDAIFCGNPACHKALGEFKHVGRDGNAREEQTVTVSTIWGGARRDLMVTKLHLPDWHLSSEEGDSIMSEVAVKVVEMETREQKSKLSFSRILLIGVALALLVMLGRQAGIYLPQFVAWVDSLGVWGPVVFVAGYVVASVAFVPGSILTLAAGAIFGLGKGVVTVFIAAMLGSAAAFLVARYLARPAIERRLAGNTRFAAIDRAIGAQGRKIVFLLRLSPVFPFNLLNYALGLTKVRFFDFFIASAGMLPGTLLYVYYGKLAGDVAALASGAAVAKGPEYYAVLVLGLVATIVVTTIVTRIARRALQEVAGE